MPSTTLSQLAKLISDSVAVIESSCAKRGVEVPSLESPFDPASEAFRADPATAKAINIASVAALQLNAIIQPPHVSVFQKCTGHFEAAAIHVLAETNTVEILREAGPKGLHVNDISKKNQLDPRKSARLLRYLATNFMFTEIEPDVFANNRLSSMLDTGKAPEELAANPLERHTGFAALMAHEYQEGAVAITSLLKTLKDPKTAFSDEPTESPWNVATGATLPYWSHIETPGEEDRLHRFSAVMQGIAAMLPPGEILKGFDWKKLTSEDVIVDVGSGVGAISLVLAKEVPDARIILQDTAPVLEHAQKVWSKEFPAVVESGRVVLQAHDFFTPQPAHNATVFLLKQILHDWSDPYASKILSKLRSAATPKTTLIIAECLLSYPCRYGEGNNDTISVTAKDDAPAPLLANYGPINSTDYILDMTMLLLHGAQERTILQFDRLLKKSGWKAVRVYRSNSSFLHQIEAVPDL